MIKFLIVLTLIAPIFGKAQTTEDSVKATINQLFDGIRNADGSAVTGAFADSAVLQTIARNKEGKTYIRNEQVKGFGDFVSRLKKGTADEQIAFETIKIDGPLAIVWTPYKFFIDGKFSHCGVNSFQLVRLNGVWKIQYLINTRRTQGCD